MKKSGSRKVEMSGSGRVCRRGDASRDGDGAAGRGVPHKTAGIEHTGRPINWRLSDVKTMRSSLALPCSESIILLSCRMCRRNPEAGSYSFMSQ